MANERQGQIIHVNLASKMASKLTFQSNIEFTARANPMSSPERHIKFSEFVVRDGQATPGGQVVQFSQPLKLYCPGLQVSGCC